jgi:hypothetical protein
VGAVLLWWAQRAQPEVGAWIVREPAARVWRETVVLGVSGVLLAAPLLGFAVYLWLFARRVVRMQRFPPPGMRVVRDTSVLYGPSALARARLLQVLAGVLVALALGLIAMLVALRLLLTARLRT